MITLPERLRALRKAAGLSQEAIGAQGFVSAPGWIKVENGQRAPSEDLIKKLVAYLVANKHVPKGQGDALRDELLTLKYLASNNAFVRDLAGHYARGTEWGKKLLAAVKPAAAKAKRSRA